MAESIDEVIQRARKMEMDGIGFYSGAAQEAANPQAQRLFDSFARDEQRHLDIIERIAQGLGVDVAGMPTPAESIRTVFTNADVELGEEQKVAASELEAIAIALGMETKSYRLYKAAAGSAEDDAVKALFERLALEENQHYEMLENTQQYLTDYEKWVLWDEHGLLTGDMSSLGL